MMINSSATNLQDPNSMVDHGYAQRIPNLEQEEMKPLLGYADKKVKTQQQQDRP